MTQIIEFPTEYIVPHQPLQNGEVSRWVCMDERFAIVDDLYRQIGGGAAGVGMDWAMARELGLQRQGNGSEVADVVEKSGAEAPAQILGALAAKEARLDGIELHTHEACAAELAAVLIAQTISERPDEVLPAARQVKPDIEDGEYEPVQVAYQRGLVNFTIMEADEGAEVLDNGTQWAGTEIPPVQRVGLVKMDHVAEDIGINHHSGVAFDVRDAMENNQPAYHVSFGDFGELHAVLNRVMPVSFEDLMTVSAIRHGAISLLLPRPTNQPLRIHTIGA